MSYLTSISGLTGSASGPPSPTPSPGNLVQTNTRNAPPAASTPAVAGATAPGETTRTGTRIPPVTDARAVNAAAAPRPGADGQAEAGRSETDREDIAKREEEAALRDLLQKELLSRIPVPVQAIPKLAGDLERVRSIGEPHGDGPANDPGRPTDPAA